MILKKLTACLPLGPSFLPFCLLLGMCFFVWGNFLSSGDQA
jgi:hypothetical protein